LWTFSSNFVFFLKKYEDICQKNKACSFFSWKLPFLINLEFKQQNKRRNEKKTEKKLWIVANITYFESKQDKSTNELPEKKKF